MEVGMPKLKFIFSLALAVLLLAVQFVSVAAAPFTQEGTPITGNIENILLEEDPESGEVIAVVVTLSSESGDPQTVRLSIDNAVALGLVTDDGTGLLSINDLTGTNIEIDPTTVLQEGEEKEHPVGSAISEFFSDLLGVDYETVMEYHEDGTGFGVIAQALWMTNTLEGDSAMFSEILDAKRSGDYSAITLPDGSTPQNWGQFRKAVMSDQDKSKENLGAIMSGRAEKDGSAQKLKPNGSKSPDADKNNNGNQDKSKNSHKDKSKNKNKDNDID
jgi:hypothetical protein